MGAGASWCDKHRRVTQRTVLTHLDDRRRGPRVEIGRVPSSTCNWQRIPPHGVLNLGKPQRFLQHALELLSKLPEAGRAPSKIEILEKLATIYTALVDDIHAIETYEALAVRAARDGLIDVEVRALIDLAYPLAWTSSQRSLEVLERAVRLSARQENPLLRTRARANCFALRRWQEWNYQDAVDFQNAFAKIVVANDRRILAPYLADRGFISWISSDYREARRSLIESNFILFETVEESLILMLLMYEVDFP